MTDSPDPLGKRALFWAPAERDEGGPRRAAERDVPGKHALFSDEARAVGHQGAARGLRSSAPRAAFASDASDRAPLAGSSAPSPSTAPPVGHVRRSTWRSS